jgi:hypothetical protein
MNNMKNQRRRLLFVIIGIVSIVGASIGVTAVPTFGEIILDPAAPTALSTFTISVDISGESISEVRVTVEECNGVTGVCYPDVQNITMTEVSAGSFTTDVTLKHNDATNITCVVNAHAAGVWTQSTKKTVNLSKEPDGNHNGTDGDDGKNSPGFEIVIFGIAVGISMFLVFGRKRLK